MKLIKLYNLLEQIIRIADENNQKILLCGDLNAKVVNMINGNKAEVSGNILRKPIEKLILQS